MGSPNTNTIVITTEIESGIVTKDDLVQFGCSSVSSYAVCRGCPEPGLRVNDISRIHWSQHLLTTEAEWPN
ncbi:hypothetical protein TNCV_4601901 [Trichonephila clavipes]|nr:hypothetical protein TNCV_4601901 [Trichonephila clavipes]